MFFTKGPVVVRDYLEQDSRVGAELREYLMKRGRKRFLAIPMFVLGEVRGFIGIQHVEGGAYRPEEIGAGSGAGPSRDDRSTRRRAV